MRRARGRHQPGEQTDRTSQAPPTSTASVTGNRRQIVRRRRVTSACRCRRSASSSVISGIPGLRRAERPAHEESAPVERRGHHTRNRYGLWRAAHPAAATDRQKSARTITARVLQQLPSSPTVLSQPPGSSSDRARLRRGPDSSGPAFPLTSSWCIGPMVGARRADRQGSLVTHAPEPSAGRRRCTLARIHPRDDSGDNAPMSGLRTPGPLVAATRA